MSNRHNLEVGRKAVVMIGGGTHDGDYAWGAQHVYGTQSQLATDPQWDSEPLT
jgi:hypothetical protein